MGASISLVRDVVHDTAEEPAKRRSSGPPAAAGTGAEAAAGRK